MHAHIDIGFRIPPSPCVNGLSMRTSVMDSGLPSFAPVPFSNHSFQEEKQQQQQPQTNRQPSKQTNKQTNKGEKKKQQPFLSLVSRMHIHRSQDQQSRVSPGLGPVLVPRDGPTHVQTKSPQHDTVVFAFVNTCTVALKKKVTCDISKSTTPDVVLVHVIQIA